MSNNPIVVGTVLAALAAVAFGVTTPFIQRLGAGVGPFTTAALLYLGAALGTFSLRARHEERREALVRLHHLPRLFAIAFFGAALAPTLFAWGLQRVPATYGALLLNAEAVFTVVLAAVIHREHVGGRVALAVALMFVGGAVTVVGASSNGAVGLLGALAVVAAVFSWALDNVLTRPFAELDPATVVRVKAVGGVILTVTLMLLLRESQPPFIRVLGLLACGATGYGMSLRLYLLAQRRIGAGRTGSVFSVAPFIGVLAALALGERPGGVTTAIAGLLFLAGLVLHLTEEHTHDHSHAEQYHDHAHTHDDGHHNHEHTVAVTGAHAHAHDHDAKQHAHPHGPDLHHSHDH